MPIFKSLSWEWRCSVQIICLAGMLSHVFKNSAKKIQGQISSRSDTEIGTWSDQCNRNKTSTKTSSTDKIKDRREANSWINWKFGRTMLMFHEASPRIWIIPGKPMTLIKSLVFIRSCGAIEPRLFCGIFFYRAYWSSILCAPCHGKARLYSCHG